MRSVYQCGRVERLPLETIIRAGNPVLWLVTVDKAARYCTSREGSEPLREHSIDHVYGWCVSQEIMLDNHCYWPGLK